MNAFSDDSSLASAESPMSGRLVDEAGALLDVPGVSPEIQAQRDENYFPYNRRPNRDLRGVAFGERDCFVTIQYGFRLVFLVDSDPGSRGRGDFFKIFPIRFESVVWGDERWPTVTNVHFDIDSPRFFIPLHHVLGRGNIDLEPSRLSEAEVFMSDDMVKVIQAGIADSVRRSH